MNLKILGCLFPQKQFCIKYVRQYIYGLGYILGDFVHKRIWSPCLLVKRRVTRGVCDKIAENVSQYFSNFINNQYLAEK
jgi:hypothetical protein